MQKSKPNPNLKIDLVSTTDSLKDRSSTRDNYKKKFSSPILEYEQFNFNRREFFELLKSPHLIRKKEHMQRIKNIYYESVKQDREYIKHRKIQNEEEQNHKKRLELWFGLKDDEEKNQKNKQKKLTNTYCKNPITRPPNLSKKSPHHRKKNNFRIQIDFTSLDNTTNSKSVHECDKEALEFVTNYLNDGRQLKLLYKTNGEIINEIKAISPTQSANLQKNNLFMIENSIDDEYNQAKINEEKQNKYREILKLAKNRKINRSTSEANFMAGTYDKDLKKECLIYDNYYLGPEKNTPVNEYTNESLQGQACEINSGSAYFPRETKNFRIIKNIDSRSPKEHLRNVDNKAHELLEKIFPCEKQENLGIFDISKDLSNGETIITNASNGSSSTKKSNNYIEKFDKRTKSNKSTNVLMPIVPGLKGNMVMNDDKEKKYFQSPLLIQTNDKILENELFSNLNSRPNTKNFGTSLSSPTQYCLSKPTENSSSFDPKEYGLSSQASRLNNDTRDMNFTTPRMRSTTNTISTNLKNDIPCNFNKVKAKYKEAQETIKSEMLKEINILGANSEQASKKSAEKLLVLKKLKLYDLQLQARIGKKLEKKSIPQAKREFQTLQNFIRSKDRQ